MKTTPIIRRAIITFAVLLLLTAAVFAAETTRAFYRELFDHLSAQDETFVIAFSGDPAELGVNTGERYGISRGVSTALNRMTVYLDEDSVALDVTRMNLNELEATYDGRNFTFTAGYLLDKAQLAWVDGQVDNLAKELFREGASDYEIVKAAYSFIATHFTYDDTLTKFTDYDGLTTGSMVCQGYALLMTKLLSRAGVGCRLITGWSQGERHGWNIVKVDGLWYCVDVTWDADENFASWDHFLMCREDFRSHDWDAAFLSEDFLNAHPLAKKSYSVPQIDILIDGTLYSGLTIRKDKQINLQARLTPATFQTVHWASTNEASVSVTVDGLLTSVSPGFAYITASVDDGGYIEGVLPVTAVDLTSCSPWADEELNALYLRQLYPAEMCNHFQQGIRRDEFAELAYLWMYENDDQPRITYRPGYLDVDNTDYWFAIMFASSRGIFDGASDERFMPEKTLTREQAAKVLFRLMQQYDYDLPELDYTEPTDWETVSDWAVDYVEFVLATGLMKGLGDGRFDPQGTLTREQAAVILERFCTMTLDKAA